MATDTIKAYVEAMENDRSQAHTWNADSITAVAFTQPSSRQPDALQLWSRAFDDSPDAFQKAAASPVGQTTATSQIGSYYVTLASQLGRVDLVLTSPPAEAIEATPRISDIERATADLVAIFLKLTKTLDVARVAAVVDCSETLDEKEATSFLSETSGVKFPEDSIDAVYQYNLRGSLKSAPYVSVNRLCTWTTGQQAYIAQQVQGRLVPLSMRPYAGFKSDVNTFVGAHLPADVLPSVIAEVFEEAVHLIRNGGSHA